MSEFADKTFDLTDIFGRKCFAPTDGSLTIDLRKSCIIIDTSFNFPLPLF